MPTIEKLYQEFKDRVAFIGIAQDLNRPDNRKKVMAIVKETAVTFPQFLEADGLTVEEKIFGKDVAALPAFALYGADGKLVLNTIGAISDPENLARLSAALRSTSGGRAKPRKEKP